MTRTIALLLTVASFAPAHASAYRVCPGGALVRKSQPCPTPTPTPTPTQTDATGPSDTISGLPPIASGCCIDKMLNCSGGDLGNGEQLIGASQPSYGWKNPNRLVPVP